MFIFSVEPLYHSLKEYLVFNSYLQEISPWGPSLQSTGPKIWTDGRKVSILESTDRDHHYSN